MSVKAFTIYDLKVSTLEEIIQVSDNGLNYQIDLIMPHWDDNRDRLDNIRKENKRLFITQDSENSTISFVGMIDDLRAMLYGSLKRELNISETDKNPIFQRVSDPGLERRIDGIDLDDPDKTPNKTEMALYVNSLSYDYVAEQTRRRPGVPHYLRKGFASSTLASDIRRNRVKEFPAAEFSTDSSGSIVYPEDGRRFYNIAIISRGTSSEKVERLTEDFLESLRPMVHNMVREALGEDRY